MAEYQKYVNRLSLSNKLGRACWGIVYALFFRPFAGRLFQRWRIMWLRIFGADVAWNVTLKASARIWAPWLLTMESYSCVDKNVRLYNPGRITIGQGATVSQGAFICTPSHDIYSRGHELQCKPVTVGRMAWVAVDAFIGPGVSVGEGAVVGARSVVVKNVDPWTVVAGNPAKVVGQREFKDTSEIRETLTYT